MTQEGDQKTKPPEGGEKTFTQDELDAIIKARLEKARNAWDSEQAEKKKAEELAKLQGDDKVKAEYDAKIAELEKRLADTDRSMRLRATEAKLATKGYDTGLASLLMGETDEDTDARIASMDKAFSAKLDEAVKAKLASGAPPAPGGGESGDSDIEALRRAAGLPPKR